MTAVHDELPTAARQPACYRGSAVCRAAVDNSALVTRTSLQNLPWHALAEMKLSAQ